MVRTIVCVVVLAFASTLGAQESTRVLTLTEEMRIRGAEHDITTNLGTVTNPAPAVLVFPNGTVAAFDAPTSRFVFIDRTGKPIGAFGRKGNGPGEFIASEGFQVSRSGVRTPMSLFQLDVGITGDGGWAYDGMQRRFVLFSADGKALRTVALPQIDPKTLVGFIPLAYDREGNVLGEITTGTSVAYTEPDGDKGTFWKPSDSALVIIAPDGHVARRVASLPPNRRSVVVSRPGIWASTFAPFESGPLRSIAKAGDRILYVTHDVTSAKGGTYHLTVIATSGDTLVSKSHPFASPPISKARADSVYEVREKSLWANQNREKSVTDEMLAKLRAAIPAVESPFESAFLGRDGTMWLKLPSRTEHRYLVFDDHGVAIGQVLIPARGTAYIREATRDAVWVTATDPDGFTDVIRYRIDARR